MISLGRVHSAGFVLATVALTIAVYGVDQGDMDQDLDNRYQDISRFSEVLRRRTASYESQRDVSSLFPKPFLTLTVSTHDVFDVVTTLLTSKQCCINIKTRRVLTGLTI